MPKVMHISLGTDKVSDFSIKKAHQDFISNNLKSTMINLKELLICKIVVVYLELFIQQMCIAYTLHAINCCLYKAQ